MSPPSVYRDLSPAVKLNLSFFYKPIATTEVLDLRLFQFEIENPELFPLDTTPDCYNVVVGSQWMRYSDVVGEYTRLRYSTCEDHPIYQQTSGKGTKYYIFSWVRYWAIGESPCGANQVSTTVNTCM